IIRKVHGKSLADAEKYAAAELRKVGVELRPGERIFVADPLKTLDRYAQTTASRIVNQSLGRSAQRLESLGLYRSPFLGGPATSNLYRYVVNENAFKSLGSLAKKAQVASNRLAQLQVQTNGTL